MKQGFSFTLVGGLGLVIGLVGGYGLGSSRVQSNSSGEQAQSSVLTGKSQGNDEIGENSRTPQGVDPTTAHSSKHSQTSTTSRPEIFERRSWQPKADLDLYIRKIRPNDVVPDTAPVDIQRRVFVSLAGRALDSPDAPPNLVFLEVMKRPEFGQTLQLTVSESLERLLSKKGSPPFSIFILNCLRNRRHYELVDSLVAVMAAAPTGSPVRGYCNDYLGAIFPEVHMFEVLTPMGMTPVQLRAFRTSPNFWQAWWRANRSRYLAHGTSQDLLLDAQRNLILSYEDRLLQSESVRDTWPLTGQDTDISGSVVRLIEEGRAGEAAALIGYVWTERHKEYDELELDQVVLHTLVNVDSSSCKVMLKRLNVQWAARNQYVDCFPDGLLALIRDGRNSEIRREAGRLLWAQAGRYTPKKKTVSKLLTFWQSNLNDPIAAEACSLAMSALFPAYAPNKKEPYNDWERFLRNKSHFLESHHGRSIEVTPEAQDEDEVED